MGDGVMDLGFFGRVEVDELGVAAELEIGDAVLVPAVLVVAQQGAVRVGRQRGLAGAGKTQEQGDAAVRTLVGRGVQRQDARFGQQVVHHGKHQFLDAAHVGRTDDNADATDEVHGHDHVRGAAVGKLAQPPGVFLLVELVGRQGEQGEGLVMVDAAPDVAGHGAEHGGRKKSGDGVVADGAHGQGVAAVGAHDPVGDVELVLFAGQRQRVLQDHGEGVGGQGQVVRRIPVDLGLDLGAADGQGVLGAAAGRFDARPGGKGAVGADQHLAVLDGGLDQVAALGVDEGVFVANDDAVELFYEIHGFSFC